MKCQSALVVCLLAVYAVSTPLLIRTSLPMKYDSQFNSDAPKLVTRIMKNYELGSFKMPRHIWLYNVGCPMPASQCLQRLVSQKVPTLLVIPSQ